MNTVGAIIIFCGILVSAVIVYQVLDADKEYVADDRAKLAAEVEALTSRLKTLETYVYVMSNKIDAVEAGKKRRCG